MKLYEPNNRISYRPDIDGLRAIAVLAVMAGHTFEDWFPGGFLGVDVFFVISGFVITLSLLTRDAAPFGSFLAAFSLRRIKRLLPALLACVGLTSAMLLFIDPTPKASLLTGAAALFGVSNFSLYFQELDYFSPSIKFNAFTHTWSLGVEEQFYLLFPVIYWLTTRLPANRAETKLLFIIFALSAASLVGFLFLQTSSPMGAYFMMPLRFWELGFGVAAAIALHRPSAWLFDFAGRINQNYLILLMIALFIIPVAGSALNHVAVVALTVLLLVGGAKEDNHAFVLINAPARYIGNISYSLYLWHWPFLTFGLLAPFSPWSNPFLAVLSAFVLAILSFHFVETPIRRLRTPRPRLWHFSTALASILAVIAIVAILDDHRKSLAPDTAWASLPPEFLPLPGSNLPFNPTCVVDGLKRQLQHDTFEACTFDPISGGDTRTLWVMGDSHAGHLQGTMLRLREKHGYGFHLVETPGIAFPVSGTDGFQPREVLFDKMRGRLLPGDVIVLSRLYLSRSGELRATDDLDSWLEKVGDLASMLENDGIHILLVGPPPMFSFEDIRSCIPDRGKSCSVDREQLHPVIKTVESSLASVAKEYGNVDVLPLFDPFCPKDMTFCSPVIKDVFMFRDRDHVNIASADLLTPHFHAALKVLD